MNEHTEQVGAALRFRKQIELLADPDEYRHYANGEPMAPDATAFLEYVRGLEQRLVAAEARAVELEGHLLNTHRVNEANRRTVKDATEVLEADLNAARAELAALRDERDRLAGYVAQLEVQLEAAVPRPRCAYCDQQATTARTHYYLGFPTARELLCAQHAQDHPYEGGETLPTTEGDL